ncbi:FAD dependent oxidoreductase [Xylanimonas cellulosilytica DSM 15894]|uniref:FAD dependent oxidoreductase n=1 Tax=Xylanimonas cellulosilytica (strain DSM 15894 / JCM 12276 / CECT 5975 / KCTC 9989 / LMG 20990 / NBRC 107835 / XIL07) TaxID=446471 RepID=D1BUL2_XYLCX|nr:NAD(P)/FAD-dependent oxidoreductase [Xylanimonas cellulosilytica]ACZ29253.1 FAD dependent oxidoreductase [Xylanimonas cellulosilytica DSM 15894]
MVTSRWEAHVEDAVVVGSGPGGLAAAVTLARAGLRVTVLEANESVGGGARTLDLGLAPGLVHDVCSAVHPMAWASPFFRAFDLRAHGVELLTPEVSYAQPLDGRSAAVAYRSLDLTVDALGADGGAWASLVGAASAQWEAVTSLAMGDKRSIPPGLGSAGALLGAARFGLGVLEQGTPVWGRRWRTPEAAALLTGVAAHSITPLPSLAGAGTALLLAALAHAGPPLAAPPHPVVEPVETTPTPDGRVVSTSSTTGFGVVSTGSTTGGGGVVSTGSTHRVSTGSATEGSTTDEGGGWAIPRGGSQAISDALVADLRAHGGDVVTGVRVRSRDDLPAARAYLFDTTPRTLLDVVGDDVPPEVRRPLAAFRHGNAAAKVDFVLNGPVPWADPDGVGAIARAGTVHVGGTREQMAFAEAEVAAGRHAERPMMLVSDPTVVDESRAVGGLRPLWTYAHVPAGSDVDVTDAVTAQLERFAPGFRDVVVTSRCVPAAQMEHHNQNYVGGDISAGAVTMWQMIARPTLRANPYRAAGGVYLCSAATPPGPGVHGMPGYHAARRALREVFGIRIPAL